ncbi:hypothetical protein M2480_003163 [Parabacteroides sp. PFB2-12]|uniref:BF3164 family lipoprotein n=1 Tax=unclassified Parabacteroides TaxID=2649774 RepID=UPI002476AC09|nr:MULTISPECIES: BF3164 family lipoprotein [unclassified Parabacteroides]MDH6344229.1 hypothetical protein [Parabacteroides sp. PM6-13]MDH6392155.1 hypothetical protein [Parabacteroides sp. PFB2-12]
MKQIYVVGMLWVVALLIGCTSNKNKTAGDESIENVVELTESVAEKNEWLPLEEGVVIVDEKDFGVVVELTGSQRVLDTEPFKLSEPEMLIKDDYFLMQNLNMGGENPGMYMLFRLPDFQYITSFGKRGNGPDEFLFPHIFPTGKKDALSYVYESSRKELYKANFDGELTSVGVEFEKVPKAVRSDIYGFAADDNTYYYTEIVPRGRAFFRAKMEGDSLQTEQLYNISFSEKHKSWSAYIGDFLVHPEGKRLVYAYKYFKRILFYDTESGVAKTVDFNKEGVVAANDIVTLGPDNVTFYWGASCSADYIYLTYSGRTPIQVTKENNEGDGYIFVEQFDWHGNPIRKYKLDHWGPTVVDEKNQRIYQLSYLYDDPLFVYEMND